MEITLDILRHSCSHIMAQAVKELWPDVKLAIGPSIENGFYYDFEKREPFSDEDLKKIEAQMQKIINQNEAFVQIFMDRNEALEMFKEHKEPFKAEIIENLTDPKVSLYKTGDDFVDLCKGPHVERAGQIKAFKLLSVAGAYWHGDEKLPMLQRIYGTCFFSKKELDEHLHVLAEAQKRDHRMLGKQLDLFSTNPEMGGGLVLWHPQGAMIRYLAEEFCKREHLNNGYEFVYSPHLGRAHLWETSGHLQWYRENMYSPMDIEGQEYFIKPMNCPFHIMIYKNDRRSYRQLPIRYAEWGTVYRFERGGVLHGLLRVRGFTQDDAHIFCSPEQMPEEIDKVLNFCLHILRSFGFSEFKAYLATRDPAKSAGDPQKWEAPTQALRSALERAGISYEVDEGGAAFYGPKIDLKIKDAIHREWQLSTIQFDFNLPERFDLTYIGEDGQEHRPYMIHRALLGSMERFFGVLIEHYAGAFPAWLSPTQVSLLPIKTEHAAFAKQVKDDLQKEGLRVIIDDRNESLNKKIREGTLKKIPYILILGDKEVSGKSVAVRKRGEGDLGSMSTENFIKKIKEEISLKK